MHTVLSKSSPLRSFGGGKTLEVAKTLYPSRSLDLFAVESEVASVKPHFFSASLSSTKYFHGSAKGKKSN